MKYETLGQENVDDSQLSQIVIGVEVLAEGMGGGRPPLEW